ncbi:MAG: hypothetical protein KAQ65_08480, partial [Candidatus Thorarchaeota archaeon]|nr:hypothetical protein [Candidatus Thorarchaeota archaeon]
MRNKNGTNVSYSIHERTPTRIASNRLGPPLYLLEFYCNEEIEITTVIKYGCCRNDPAANRLLLI